MTKTNSYSPSRTLGVFHHNEQYDIDVFNSRTERNKDRRSGDESKPSRKGLIIKTMAGFAIAVAAGIGFANSHNHYGYDPSRNPSPPTYNDTHKDINPADIHQGDG